MSQKAGKDRAHPPVEAVNAGPLRSGKLARLAGVSSDTLRHYERRGLIAAPHRSSNGYREYPVGALDRVILIRRALSVGFTLDELGEILQLRDRGGAPCHRVRQLAAEKLDEVEALVEELGAVRRVLKLLLRNWDKKLASTRGGERAGLLDGLAARRSLKDEHTSLLTSPWLRRNRKKKENES